MEVKKWKDRSEIDKNDHADTIIGKQYAQQDRGGAVVGADGRIVPHITCLKCNKKGYYSKYCPEAKDDGEGMDVSHVRTSLGTFT